MSKEKSLIKCTSKVRFKESSKLIRYNIIACSFCCNTIHDNCLKSYLNNNPESLVLLRYLIFTLTISHRKVKKLKLLKL